MRRQFTSSASGPFKERPFFRTAIKGAPAVLMTILKGGIDPKTMVLDAITAGRVGMAMTARIQEQVTVWHVIDTGKLRRSTSRVVK